MAGRPLRWSLFAGVALLLVSTGCMAGLILRAGLSDCLACAANGARVNSLALDRMSFTPTGRPTRAAARPAEWRFDPCLPFPPPDPAETVLPSPFFQEAPHAARD